MAVDFSLNLFTKSLLKSDIRPVWPGDDVQLASQQINNFSYKQQIVIMYFISMFTIAHNTFFVIVYGLATSFNLQYGPSSGKLYKNLNVNSTLSTVFNVYVYVLV